MSKTVFFTVLLFFWQMVSFADLIVTKRGNEISGKIIAVKDRYVKIKAMDIEMTFFQDDIEEIKYGSQDQEVAGNKETDRVDEISIYNGIMTSLNAEMITPELLKELTRKAHTLLNAAPNSELPYITFGRIKYEASFLRAWQNSDRLLSEAEGLLFKAVQINSDNFDANLYYSYVCRAGRDLTVARKYRDECARLIPESVDLYLLDAAIAADEARWRDVINKCEKVLASSDSEYHKIKAFIELSNAYAKKGNIKEAETYYLKRIEMQPDAAWHYYDYSEFLTDQVWDFDRAIEYAEKSISLADLSKGHRVLARAYYAKGKKYFFDEQEPSKGVEYFIKAIEHDPEHAGALYGMGLFYYKEGVEQSDYRTIRLAKKYYELVLVVDIYHEEAKEQLEKVNRLLDRMKET